MEMSVGALDHYNVSTRKLKETVQFYEEILGFVNGPRPQFNFPGAWPYSAGHAVLHLNDIPRPTGSSAPIQASSIMSRLAAAASRLRSSTSPAKACPTA
jgi:catechol 2,3-dioxygenase-like lactoylglutathione lyase family enzyme